MTSSLQFTPGSPAELRKWSAAVRAAVQRLALPTVGVAMVGPSGGADPARAELLSPAELAIEVSDGPRVTAVLRRPDSATNVVIVHSADEVAASLAELGLATLSLSIVDRDEVLLRLVGRCMLARLVDEMLAAVQWASGEFDRVGLFGHGAGAAVALHAALLTELPLAVSGHNGSYRDLDKPALPGILRHADLPDLYAALAPRPLLLEGAPQPVLDAYKTFDASVSAGPVGEFFARAFRAAPQMPSVPPLKVHFDLRARVEVADRIDQVLASGMLTQGALVGRFEQVAARYTGGETVAVSSGTAALDIAYQLLDFRGRTVLAPVNTFFATAASIERMGGKVEFVDTELDGFGIDPISLRDAIAKNDDIAAVVAVHIGGVIAPSFKEVLAECAARDIPVVEDAAHALGSRLDGRLAGTFAQMAAYSLHPAKVATSGEGGLFTAVDPAQLDAARKLRDHGKISVSQNIHDRLGNNWRLSEVHAAVGLSHVSRLDELLAMRRSLAAWYDEHLDAVPRIKRYIPPAGVESNYYKYIAFLDPAVDRAELKARLRQRHGVSLAGEVYDVLLSEQPYFAQRFTGRTFDRAQWFARHHICLPAFPSMTTAQQLQVIEALTSELS